MSAHTPEPWFLKRDGVIAERATGKVIATLGYNVSVGSAEDESNAARIVACVNALAALSDEALAGGWTYAGQNAYALKMEREIRALRAQCDEQLGALKDLCGMTHENSGAALRRARALIDKAKVPS